MSGGPFERVGDSIFSLDPDNRHLCDCGDCIERRATGRPTGTMTRAEWDAWAAENMPNGYCICNPATGKVCGQHDPRYQPLPGCWSKVWRLPGRFWPAHIHMTWKWHLVQMPSGVWLDFMNEDDVFSFSFRIEPFYFALGISTWWDDGMELPA